MKVFRIFTVVLSVCFLVFMGCSSQKDSEQNIQKFSKVEPVELATIDLSLSTDGYSQSVLSNTNEGLYRLGKNEKLEPAGAEGQAIISENGLLYRIFLNKKAKWSDGKPVVANDYVYSWQRTVDPKTQSEIVSLFSPVKNAEKIAAGQVPKEELGIHAVNKYELLIELEKPTPYFSYLLSYPNFFPQRKDIVERYGKLYAMTSENTVYNGPFCLKGYKGPGISTSWQLTKNQKYWDKENVSLDVIDTQVVKDQGTAYNLYKDGKINETYLSGEFYQQNKKNKELITINQTNSFYIQANVSNSQSIIANKLVREAISYATNRKQLTDHILNNGSIPSESISAKGLAFSPKEHIDFSEISATKAVYNKQKAHELWGKYNPDKKPVSVELTLSDTENSKVIGEFLQAQWQEALPGLTVKITPLPFSMLLEQLQIRNYELVLTGAKPEYPDPTSFLDYLTTNNPQNYSGYSNQQVDQLMDEVHNHLGTNKEKRWDTMVKANELVMQDLPLIPLLQQRKTYLRNQSVQGIISHSVGAEFDYKQAKITGVTNHERE
ncbi:TPA: peptide ABC transporter substrate-binding protein [Enterococcus faecalis]